jgi:hypothetical protein
MFRFVFLFAAAMLPIYAEDARMQAFNRALGVDCAHCHTLQDWKRADRPEFVFARKMIKMTDGLSAGTLRGLGGITCWSCHRGSVKPARMPRASWESLLAKWPEELKLSPDDEKKPRRDVFKNIQSTPDEPAGNLPRP